MAPETTTEGPSCPVPSQFAAHLVVHNTQYFERFFQWRRCSGSASMPSCPASLRRPPQTVHVAPSPSPFHVARVYDSLENVIDFMSTGPVLWASWFRVICSRPLSVLDAQFLSPSQCSAHHPPPYFVFLPVGGSHAPLAFSEEDNAKMPAEHVMIL